MNRYYHYELLPWVKEHADKLNKGYLSANPHAIDYIIDNGIKIDWYFFCSRIWYYSLEELSIYQNHEEWNRRYVKHILSNGSYSFSNCYLKFINNQTCIKILLEKLNTSSTQFFQLLTNKDDLVVKYIIKKIKNADCFGNTKYFNNEKFWNSLCENENDLIVDLLLNEYPDKINYKYLSSNTNPRVIDLLRNNKDKISYHILSCNISAIDLLLENPEQIVFCHFFFNQNINIKKVIKNINILTLLSTNSTVAAYQFIAEELLKHIDFVNLSMLSFNQSPLIVEYLKNNPEKINWRAFSINPSAIGILSENINKIDWNNLSPNKSIFQLKYDYPLIRTVNDHIFRSLTKVFYHPKRLNTIFHTDESSENDESEILFDKCSVMDIIKYEKLTKLKNE